MQFSYQDDGTSRVSAENMQGEYQDLFLEGSRIPEFLDTLDQLGFLFVPVLLQSSILSSHPYYIVQTKQHSLGSQTIILTLCCAPIQGQAEARGWLQMLYTKCA